MLLILSKLYENSSSKNQKYKFHKTIKLLLGTNIYS